MDRRGERYSPWRSFHVHGCLTCTGRCGAGSRLAPTVVHQAGTTQSARPRRSGTSARDVAEGESVFSWFARVVQRLWREMVGFSAVGLVGVTCDIITFNVLIAGFHAPKVVASLSGNAFGTFVSYLGNRYWVFRKREHRQSAAEISLFVLVSVIAILITATCVAFNEYVLGLRTLIEANIAQFLVGQGLGSIFRFWAMHVFVFPESRRRDAGERSGNQDSERVDEGAAHLAGAGGLQAVGQLSEAD